MPITAGGPRPQERLRPVYVCLCNALTDRHVKHAVTTAGVTKTSEVYAACGCRAQCGQCVRSVVNLLRGIVGTEPELHAAD
ncbi:(2Fe-2S)-binding protein [Rhodopila sp.]|jgi:bacterioferritin-associated ferredoxin|uniref:(2Fe-2S)-binding protein n=1 Tax=Rhodopila sp. TaxID=2480087 RepID=UPI002CC072F2|nr:(2Fe-2S)-binding protein [Rhodopila sp.]HVZ08466.1 (2Fe-2S)-binding protein [Rhodopila sp.]